MAWNLEVMASPLGYGLEQPVGHVDFYPNGGKDQPGCSILDAPSVGMSNIYNLDRAADQVGRHLVSCSHTRAISLYIESLRGDGDCVFVGHECSSHEDFQAGVCFDCSGGRCAQMGYNSYAYKARADEFDRKNVKFYLNTGAGPEHFCRKFLLTMPLDSAAQRFPLSEYQYLLDIHLASPPSAERWVQGFLTVNIHGTKEEVRGLSLTPE